MSTFAWPTEEGWPYPDSMNEEAAPDGEADDDLLAVQIRPDRFLSGLDPLEREVVTARFGLCGRHERTMRELAVDTGLPRRELREALGSGLAKLRVRHGA